MFFFIDRTGRRTLLIAGALGMGICHFVIGGVLGTYSQSVPGGVQGNNNVTFSVTGPPSHTVIAFSYLLIIIYALTLAPVAWIYAAEVWSLGTRATGMSLAAVSNWVFNFALGLFTPPAFLNIKYKIFIIFGVLCFGSAIQTFFTYPETCGKTIEEVELLFAKGAPPAWKTKKGGSRLEAEVQAVLERKRAGEEVHAEVHHGSEKLPPAAETKESV
jgi:MFS family permease